MSDLSTDPQVHGAPSIRQMPSGPSASAHRQRGRTARLVPSGGWLTGLAFAVVALPFLVALVALLAQSGTHLTLADDLALIDLHTRKALAWKQQLGVFDTHDWSHPGPSYFYLQSLVYRVLGGGARSLFVGATFWNGVAAVACVGVVRYRSTPARTLWAAVWICGLVALLAASGPAATTYSESLLGGLVSPWNPMVVILPLLLTVLLCAAAIDRSGLSLLAAVVTGSFVVQTDISTLPVVAVVGGVATLAWLATSGMDLVGLRPGESAASRRRAWAERRHWVTGPVLAVSTLAVLVVMWLPPIVQQRHNHPGNLTLVFDYFRTHHGTYSVLVGWRSLLSVEGVVIHGPAEVMRSDLGLVVLHPVTAWIAVAIAVLAAVGGMAGGIVQRNRTAWGLGLLSLAGSAAVVVAATRVQGFIFGYLLVWAVVLPISGVIAPGLLRFPARWSGVGRRVAAPGRPLTATTGFRVALCVAGIAVCAWSVVRVTAIPPLTAASDPNVGTLSALVTRSLVPGDRVFVGDAGAGTVDTQLLDTEEFLGLVNLLDEAGYRPTVNHAWRVQVGPGYGSDGTEPRQITLATWVPSSPMLPGYVGRVGDMAVTVTDGAGNPVPATDGVRPGSWTVHSPG